MCVYILDVLYILYILFIWSKVLLFLPEWFEWIHEETFVNTSFTSLINI